MLLTQIPVKFPTVWATGADPSEITNPIPTPPQAGGRASLTIGWPDPTFQPLASGGNPPWGKDFNGIFFMITAWLQWVNAGGPVPYDATFQAAIGGYPQGALLQTATKDRYWLSTTDNNLTNPDTGGAGWVAFPDVIVQKQAGNYAHDIGSSNAFRVTLSPKPASNAAIIGAPIRVIAAQANTINNPTIAIDNVAGDGALPMVNANGTPIAIGQISGPGCLFEGLSDGTVFRVGWPAPLQAIPSVSGAITGVIYAWSSETVPSWGLECNGAQYAITAFPNLFNIIQFRYGGDGVNNFRVPDLRGGFMRGWDHGRGLDPGATTRTQFANSGSVVGDHVGSWERTQLNAADLVGLSIHLTGDGTAGGPPVVGDDRMPLAIFSPFSTSGGYNQWLQQIGQNVQAVGGGAFELEDVVITELVGKIRSIGGSGETRPVNMDVMYVIAF